MPLLQGFFPRTDSERIVALTCDGKQQLGRAGPRGWNDQAICGRLLGLAKSPAGERPPVHHRQDGTCKRPTDNEMLDVLDAVASSCRALTCPSHSGTRA